MPGPQTPPCVTAVPTRSSLKGGANFHAVSEDEEPKLTPKRTSFASGKDLAIVHPVWDTHYQRTFFQKHSGTICCLCLIVMPALSLLLIVLRSVGAFQ